MRWTPYLQSVRRFWNHRPGPRPRTAIPTTLVLESLEERAVPAILFSNTGSRSIVDTGGPILSRMQVDLIFWGAHWTDLGNQTLRTNVQNTVNAILNSTYFDGLLQYRGINHGSLLRADTITTTSPPASFTTQPGGDVSTFVANNINNGTLPSPNGQILYFVVPQPGSTPSDCGCTGRHLAGIASNNRVFPYGLTTNPTNVSLDTLSVIISHEMAEAASDPEWNVSIGGTNQSAFHAPGGIGDEIGDGEAQNYTYRLNGALVQAFLSQNDHSYIITNGSTNNFLVSSSRILTFQESFGGSNTIEINRIANGVAAQFNGSTAQFEPNSIHGITVNALSGDRVFIDQTGADAPVTVNLGGGSESVSISFGPGNLGTIQGSVAVNGGTGSDTLALYDNSVSSDFAYTITDTSVSRPGAAPITFSGQANNNIFLLGSRGDNRYTVNNTEPRSTTTINTGDGDEEVDVARTTGSLTVNLGRGADGVLVGGPVRNLDLIAGGITVVGGAPDAYLDVNDSGKAFINVNTTLYTVTSSSVQRFGIAAITYRGLGQLDLRPGANPAGFLQVSVLGTAAGTDTTIGNLVPAGGVPDLVAVGSTNNSLDSIQGPLEIGSPQRRTQLILADSGTTTPETYTFASSNGINSLVRSGAARVTYGSNSVVAVGLAAAQSANTIEVTGTSPTTETDIGAGNGRDVVNVRATSGPLIVNLHNSGNTVNVGSTTNSLGAIQGAITLNGPGQDGTLRVNDQGTATARTYTLGASTITRSGVATITYSNFPNVILNGGSGANTYTVTGTSASTFLSTGSGTTTVNVQATAQELVVANSSGGSDAVNLSNAGSVQSILGPVVVTGPENGTSRTTLTVDDSADPSARVGQHFSSFGFGRLTGLAPGVISYDLLATVSATVKTGSGTTMNVQQTFVPLTLLGSGAVNVGNTQNQLADIRAPLTVNGQAGNGVLNVNDQGTTAASAYTITPSSASRADGPTINYAGLGSLTLNGGSGGNSFTLQGVFAGTTLAIDGGSGTNTLQGPDTDTAWHITGTDAGSLAGSVSFTSMQSLTGGAGNNTFAFQDGGSLDGTLSGSGAGTLDYSTGWSGNVLVNLQTGLASGVGGGIANIQNVIGASGGGLGFYNILVGNGGDYLQGGDGRRNLLIAGASASTLIGGNGDDILIGGTTAYDQEADMHSLIAVMDYWSNTTDDYFTRVNNLTTGNGVPLLDATTVVNNGGGNTLIGNNSGAGEMNLFYGLDPSLETTDYNPGIGEVFINV